MTPERIQGLVEHVRALQAEYSDADTAFEWARTKRVNALNALNAAQGELDKAVEQLRAESPWESD